MEFLSIFLIVYGVLVLFLVLSKNNLVFNNPKTKFFQKFLGAKGTYWVFLFWGLASLIGGILLYQSI